MSEKQKILIQLHELLREQIEALEKGLTPEGVVQFNERLTKIRELAERLRDDIDAE